MSRRGKGLTPNRRRSPGRTGFIAAQTGARDRAVTYDEDLCASAEDCFDRAAALALDREREEFFTRTRDGSAPLTGATPGPVDRPDVRSAPRAADDRPGWDECDDH